MLWASLKKLVKKHVLNIFVPYSQAGSFLAANTGLIAHSIPC